MAQELPEEENTQVGDMYLLKDDGEAIEQPASNIEISGNSKFMPNPRKAVLFAIIPGGGQIYNRKYWKLPIVYGAFTGLAYGIKWNGAYYNDYKKAYASFSKWQQDNSNPTGDFMGMIPYGMTLETINQASFNNTLRQRKDIYRRNRDLCIIGTVGMYVLTLVDAFVDAQLFDFDISPDLSMNISPLIQMNTNNAAFGMQCNLTF
jgi:hypothetical protein